MHVSRVRTLLVVSLLSIPLLGLLGLPTADAQQASLVQLQLRDSQCTAQTGTARGNGSGDNNWSSWASDSDGWDPDCVRVRLDDVIAQQLDIRLCIQVHDTGVFFGGEFYGDTECTPWASDGGGWSSWAWEDDKWAYDDIRIKVDSRGLSGRYISNFRIGFQSSIAIGDNCGNGVGTPVYTPYMSSGGGWSSWEPDPQSEGSIACARINLSNETISGQSCTLDGVTVPSGSTATFYKSSVVPYGYSCTGSGSDGEANSITRTCTNGILSGSSSYNQGTCSVAEPASCTLDGVTVPSGSSHSFYDDDVVPYGDLCADHDLSRTCTNGILSGSSSYNQGTCMVDPTQANLLFTANGFSGNVSVRQGGFINLVWDGGNATSCSVTGIGSFVSTSTPSIPSTLIDGDTWVQINQKSIFTFSCTKDTTSKTETATINIVPSLQEI